MSQVVLECTHFCAVMTAFLLHLQIWAAVTETTWPTNPKTFAGGHLQKNVCYPRVSWSDSDSPGHIEYVTFWSLTLESWEASEGCEVGSDLVRQVFLKIYLAAVRQTRGAKCRCRKMDGSRNCSSLGLKWWWQWRRREQKQSDMYWVFVRSWVLC